MTDINLRGSEKTFKIDTGATENVFEESVPSKVKLYEAWKCVGSPGGVSEMSRGQPQEHSRKEEGRPQREICRFTRNICEQSSCGIVVDLK